MRGADLLDLDNGAVYGSHVRALKGRTTSALGSRHMTSPQRRSSEPQLAMDHAQSGVRPGNDDELIDKLRTRAWDPGLRFDRAEVPLAWIEERYGQDGIERIQGRIISSSSSGKVTLDARAEEIASYFADAPREPLFAPITRDEVDAAEQIIGRPLPELLRRIYTEVGNGGFGPDAGIASLTAGPLPERHLLTDADYRPGPGITGHHPSLAGTQAASSFPPGSRK